MKFWKSSSLGISLIVIVIMALSSQSAQMQEYFLRFTTPLPTVICNLIGSDLSVSLNSINNEYNLPSGATLERTYFRENEPFTLLPVSLTSGTGSGGYPSSGFSDTIPGVSIINARLQYDLIIEGIRVYRSTLNFACAGSPTGTASITNETSPEPNGTEEVTATVTPEVTETLEPTETAEATETLEPTQEVPEGTQTVEAPVSSATPRPPAEINDGRINPQNFAPIALYCEGSTLTTYMIDASGQGQVAWRFDFASAAPTLPDQFNISLTRTAEGRYGILAPQHDGKMYLFIFNGCPAPGVVGVYVSDPTTGEFVSTK